MNAILVLLVVLLPVAWLVTEFRWGKKVRVALGIASLLATLTVAVIVGSFQRLNYNAWYGDATARLVAKTLDGLEAGERDRVVRMLRQLQTQFEPTYEHRAHYDELVNAVLKSYQEPISSTGP